MTKEKNPTKPNKKTPNRQPIKKKKTKPKPWPNNKETNHKLLKHLPWPAPQELRGAGWLLHYPNALLASREKVIWIEAYYWKPNTQRKNTKFTGFPNFKELFPPHKNQVA